MLGKNRNNQLSLFIQGHIEDFIPNDHILYKVNQIIDLSWIEKEVASRYCKENGRPSIAPECAIRLMLAGFFLGIVHDRKLMREAQVNLAIRWFAGYSLEDKIPNHSSLTRIRQRWGEDCFLKVFEKTVEQCIAHNLVSAETVHVDATLIRADVNWLSVAQGHGRKVIEENGDDDKPTGKKMKVFRTDPDAGLARSCLQPSLRPTYKQHSVVDDKRGVIVDVDVTSSEEHESRVVTNAIERTESRIGPVSTMTGDKGYSSGAVYECMEKKGIDPLIVPQYIQRKGRGGIPKEKFKYDALHNRVKCPSGRNMTYIGDDQKGKRFKSKRTECARCHLEKRCLGTNRQRYKTIRIGEGYDALLRARRRYTQRWNDQERRLYTRHKYRVEGVHGEAKEQHGLRRSVRRRLWNVKIQSYLTAAVINLKRLAKALCINPSGLLFLLSETITMFLQRSTKRAGLQPLFALN